MLIPIYGVDGQVVSHQYRPDNPRARHGKPVKYESLPGTPPRIDVPPRVREHLGNPATPLWITEGSKKADSAVARGLVCVSLSGVWNWRGRNQHGGKVAIGDFESIAWNGRKVYLAFDSDVTTKPEVRDALNRLVAYLKSKGGNVQVIHIPSPDGEKMGLDDYFASGGTVEQLLASAGLMPNKVEDPSKRASMATELVELVLKSDIEFWHSPEMEPYATYKVGGRPESSKLRSSAFSLQCRSLLYEAKKKPINSDALREAVESMAAKAVYEGACHPVNLRIAWESDSIYLYLCDDQKQVVHISPGDWTVIAASDCPAKFCPSKHARGLPIPSKGGSLDELSRFLSIDPEDFALVEGFLVGCFLPEGTLPILAVSGEQGSGKSFGCKLIRSLIDPDVAPNRSIPRDLSALTSAVTWNHVVTLDNVSGVSHQLSDALCCVASGTGFASRQLYTDSEEHVTIARRPIIINGIEDVIGRADLASRTLLIRFKRIGDEGRIPEGQLQCEFEAKQSEILGGILDRVATALAMRGSIKHRTLPRLADLAHWVSASEPEVSRGRFVDQLFCNRAEQNAVAIESDLLAMAVMEITGSLGEIEASSTELFKILCEREGGAHGRLPHGWPKSPKALTAALRRLAPILRQVGVECSQGRSGEKRYWILTNAKSIPPDVSHLSEAS
ncbi:MAG: DUF3854 domain-containing protein [Fimbriimonadaceae bacterium]|nr:DUF3854 domain-containing protein [Fimbriimonadaceae bacterium]